MVTLCGAPGNKGLRPSCLHLMTGDLHAPAPGLGLDLAQPPGAQPLPQHVGAPWSTLLLRTGHRFGEREMIGRWGWVDKQKKESHADKGPETREEEDADLVGKGTEN